MSAPEATPPASRAVRPRAVALLATAAAVCGGLLMLAAAVLVSVSVARRWLLDSPIQGDFEIVKMATGVAVFAFLPYCQLRRGNIMVDTFTGGLSERARQALDSLWAAVYGGAMGLIAYCLWNGTADAVRSGETMMMLPVQIWPAIAACAALSALLAATAVATAAAPWLTGAAGRP
ncbi:MAG: TRAP transporter small permease [Alphaproteobacteria bacterium]|nr:TRAP transporter small permease [Alphaproteobacteria bacterium]